jgi:O-antigen ligase/capsule polysaccharide modification protein KpsS
MSQLRAPRWQWRHGLTHTTSALLAASTASVTVAHNQLHGPTLHLLILLSFIWLAGQLLAPIVAPTRTRSDTDRAAQRSAARWLATPFLLYALIAILSAGHAGFDDRAVNGLDYFSYFLAGGVLLPFLVAMRPSADWFWFAIGTAALLSGLYAGWEMHQFSAAFQHATGMDYRAGGSKGKPIPFGDIATLTTALSVLAACVFYATQRRGVWLFILAAVAGGYASLVSGTRGAWVFYPTALLVIGVYLWQQFPTRRRWIVMSLFSLTLSASAVLAQSAQIQSRFTIAVTEIQEYHPGAGVSSGNALGERFEMWRAALRAAQEQPLLGIGVGHLNAYFKQAAATGLISPAIAAFNHGNGHTHAHNDYLHTLATCGVLGLIGLLLVYLVPLTVFVRAARHEHAGLRGLGYAGILTVLGYMQFSLTDSVLLTRITAAFFVLLCCWLLALSIALRQKDALRTAPNSIAFIEPGSQLVHFLVAVAAQLAPEYRPLFFSSHPKSRSLLRRLGIQPVPKSPLTHLFQIDQSSQPPIDKSPQPPFLKGGLCGVFKGKFCGALSSPPFEKSAPPSPPFEKGGLGGIYEIGQLVKFHFNSDFLLTRLRSDRERALVQNRAPAVAQLADALADWLHAAHPAAIVLWNGSGLAAALAEQWARQHGVPVLFAENGYLPHTLQLDLEGVNAFSSLRHLDLADCAARTYSTAQQQEFSAMLAEYRAGRAPPITPPPHGRLRPSLLAYLQQGWRDWWQRPQRRRINRRIGHTQPQLPERFVLFALQVAADSQLILHSPLYGNRLEIAIAEVEAALHELDPTLALVVKLHPADRDKTDYDAVAAAHPAVIWVGGGDVRPLLAQAQCVVTVNSTVGVEALLFGKPVVLLGNNFYGRDGLVYLVRERAALLPQLRRALTELPDSALIEQYLRYLYFFGLVRAHWRDHAPQSIEALAQRMRELLRTAPSRVASSGTADPEQIL